MDLTLQTSIEFVTFVLALYLGYSGLRWWRSGLPICLTKALLAFLTFDEFSRAFLFANVRFLFALLGWFGQGLIGWFVGDYIKRGVRRARTPAPAK